MRRWLALFGMALRDTVHGVWLLGPLLLVPLLSVVIVVGGMLLAAGEELAAPGFWADLGQGAAGIMIGLMGFCAYQATREWRREQFKEVSHG